MNENRCETCAWYQDRKAEQDAEKALLKGRPTGEGYIGGPPWGPRAICHLFPVGTDVQPTDWCGQWKAKEGAA